MTDFIRTPDAAQTAHYRALLRWSKPVRFSWVPS